MTVKPSAARAAPREPVAFVLPWGNRAFPAEDRKQLEPNHAPVSSVPAPPPRMANSAENETIREPPRPSIKAGESENSKLEYQNPKQIRIRETWGMLKPSTCFETFLYSRFGPCFEIRISDFP
jgi:hypothetical protein